MTEYNEQIEAKDLLQAASPFIKSLVDTIITPKLIKFKEKLLFFI